MKPVYLISDVHAGIRGDGLDAAKLEAFAHVLERASSEASEVVLLGDIFDFWFEWKDVIPSRHLPWLQVLKNAADRGLPMSIFPGNHDFKLGGVLESTVGLRLPGDLERRSILGSQVLLHHGDGLDPEEKGYLFLKSVLRSRWAQWAFGLLHPDLGMRLADWAGAGDRDHVWGREELVAYLGRALPLVLQPGDEHMIMGHVHVAGAFSHGSSRVWTLPPFCHESRGYGIFDGSQLHFAYLEPSSASETLEVALG